MLNILLILVLDATSKFPPGLTDGKWFWMGSYEMCMKIRKNCDKQKDVNGTEIGCPGPKTIPMDANYCVTNIGYLPLEVAKV